MSDAQLRNSLFRRRTRCVHVELYCRLSISCMYLQKQNVHRYFFVYFGYWWILTISYVWMPFKFHNWFHNMLTHLFDNTARELCSAQPAVVPTNLLTAELSWNWRQTNGYTLYSQSSDWLSSELRAAVELVRRVAGRATLLCPPMQQLWSARLNSTCTVSRMTKGKAVELRSSERAS